MEDGGVVAGGDGNRAVGSEEVVGSGEDGGAGGGCGD